MIRFDACSCSDLFFAPSTAFRLQSSASTLTFDVLLGLPSFLPTNIKVIGSGNIRIKDAVTASRSVLIKAPGNITIGHNGFVSASGSGNAIVLAAGGNFINNAGSTALDLGNPNGRWLIYSNAPGSDVFGDLDSGNTAIWNSTYTTLPPANVPAGAIAPGDRYVFALQPTVTVTTTDVSKTYGDDATAAVAAAYIMSSLQPGVQFAFLGDSGVPLVVSAGAAVAADVALSPYAVTASQGTLPSGYDITFINTGLLP